MAGWTAIKSGLSVTSGVAEAFTNSTLGKFAFKEHEELTKLPVGGRIFYVHSDNGATYHFYDSSNNELTTHTKDGLATATKYTVEGTPTADKFYVYNTTIGTVKGRKWGNYGLATGMTEDSIGSGKTNTNIMLTSSKTGYYGALWTWLSDTINAGSGTDGCTDWYIGSTKEQDELIKSNLVTWYNTESGHITFSSVEDATDARLVYAWNYFNQKWETDVKTATQWVVLIRSF